jgi:hypothetical protein
MDRNRVGAYFLIASIGLSAGCTSFSSSRFNLFNHNKTPREGCVEVGAGPICDMPIAGGCEQLPAGSGMMLPGDGAYIPSSPIPSGPGVPILPNPNPAGTNFMPPASPTTGAPSRLTPMPPTKPIN